MKLMLVDDHPLFLEGLKYLLETHGVAVEGTANDGEEAVELTRRIHPDIILMDIRMPKCSGIDAMKRIKAELPDVRVVMLTTSDEDDDLFEAIKNGASGYLLKSVNADELIDMLSNLENNEVPLSAGLASRILKEFRRNNCDEGILKENLAGSLKNENLTDRQLEILEMAANGVTYRKIGERLDITERTVKYHMGRIIDQLHLKNRTQAIAYAASIGLTKDK